MYTFYISTLYLNDIHVTVKVYNCYTMIQCLGTMHNTRHIWENLNLFFKFGYIARTL